MAISKQAFYEGAALHLVARTGQIARIRYEPPFFLLNDHLWVLLKYSTKIRSPWGFTFTADEQALLLKTASRAQIAVGLICGADGVAAFNYQSFLAVAPPRATAVHIACFRDHGEHYEISGPDGPLRRKVAPSNWQRILELEVLTS